jgi:hypothetical protein
MHTHLHIHQGPVFVLAAILSLGPGGGNPSCPARPAPPARARPSATRTAAPTPLSSWMDYVDFRRGSGDMLARLGRSLAPDTSHPGPS